MGRCFLWPCYCHKKLDMTYQLNHTKKIPLVCWWYLALHLHSKPNKWCHGSLVLMSGGCGRLYEKHLTSVQSMQHWVSLDVGAHCFWGHSIFCIGWDCIGCPFAFGFNSRCWWLLKFFMAWDQTTVFEGLPLSNQIYPSHHIQQEMHALGPDS